MGVDLPAGSGWDVYAALENDPNISWERGGYDRAYRPNHGQLAEESVLSTGPRAGGNDIIDGGERQ